MSLPFKQAAGRAQGGLWAMLSLPGLLRRIPIDGPEGGDSVGAITE